MGVLSSLVSQPAANTQGTSSANSSATSLAGNFNTFLTLLTTQLKNQDPTSPMDSNQFTQQLVAFAGVQQQLQTNTLLQQLVTNSQTNQVAGASSFIGTTVQASGDQGAITATGGSAEFGYTLSGKASTAKVTITDSSGNVVFQGTGSGNNGSNTVTWDGTNSATGAKEPVGVYKISVTATDSSGNAVTATPFTIGKVTSASIANGAVVLNIGPLQIPESSVTSVTNLPGTPAATS